MVLAVAALLQPRSRCTGEAEAGTRVGAEAPPVAGIGSFAVVTGARLTGRTAIG